MGYDLYTIKECMHHTSLFWLPLSPQNLVHPVPWCFILRVTLILGTVGISDMGLNFRLSLLGGCDWASPLRLTLPRDLGIRARMVV